MPGKRIYGRWYHLCKCFKLSTMGKSRCGKQLWMTFHTPATPWPERSMSESMSFHSTSDAWTNRNHEDEEVVENLEIIVVENGCPVHTWWQLIIRFLFFHAVCRYCAFTTSGELFEKCGCDCRFRACRIQYFCHKAWHYLHISLSVVSLP